MNLRLIACSVVLGAAARGAVVSESWREGRLTLTLEDGAAAVEWITPATFRFWRTWGGEAPAAIRRDPVLVARQDTGGVYRMRSRYLVVEVDGGGLGFRALAEGKLVVAGTARGGKLELAPASKASGGRWGFFMTPDGYGYSRAAEGPADVVVYYGPSPKEILEQLQLVRRAPEVTLRGWQSPTEAVPAIGSWEGLASLVERLGTAGFSGELYPAVDTSGWAGASAEVRQRALDLATVLPLVAGGGVDRAAREAFTPYLTTYLREAYERGIPAIRALAIQFPKDEAWDERRLEFMLGDELLVTPVMGAGNRRRVRLPRGRWTDLRTNVEYEGRREVEIEAPPGRVPVFARNGSLFPLASGKGMELHYFPSLAGEFFLWEEEIRRNSQFHAAPAGELLRLEVETKVARAYEWVAHHTGEPAEVGEDGPGGYRRVAGRSALRAGTWWHDGRRKNLHVMLRAEAGTDRVVYVRFAGGR